MKVHMQLISCAYPSLTGTLDEDTRKCSKSTACTACVHTTDISNIWHWIWAEAV